MVFSLNSKALQILNNRIFAIKQRVFTCYLTLFITFTGYTNSIA